MLTVLLGIEVPSGTRAWGLWRTGPHMGWHLVDLFPTRAMALLAVASYQRDGFSDGLVVRRVVLGTFALKWSRPPVASKTPRVKRRKRRAKARPGRA